MFVVVPIIVMNKISPSMPSFLIPHINNTNTMFIQYFNFEILVYNPTTISLCNHMSQFKNTERPVVLLSHEGKLLLKLSITDMYAYWIFVEYLRYKVLTFCLCGLFGRNRLLIWTTLPYNYNSYIQRGLLIFT